MQNLSQIYSKGDEKLVKEKATVLVTNHLFSGINRAMREKFDSSSPGEIVAQTLLMIGVGVKVAIEYTAMAADARLIPTDEDVIQYRNPAL
jgi:hypothetical protein